MLGRGTALGGSGQAEPSLCVRNLTVCRAEREPVGWGPGMLELQQMKLRSEVRTALRSVNIMWLITLRIRRTSPKHKRQGPRVAAYMIVIYARTYEIHMTEYLTSFNL